MIPRNLRPMLFLIAAMAQSVALAEPGVTQDAILIGQSAPLSGVNAPLGVEQRDGALAYFEFINKRGGVYGWHICFMLVAHCYEHPVTAAVVHMMFMSVCGLDLIYLRGIQHVVD